MDFTTIIIGSAVAIVIGNAIKSIIVDMRHIKESTRKMDIMQKTYQEQMEKFNETRMEREYNISTRVEPQEVWKAKEVIPSIANGYCYVATITDEAKEGSPKSKPKRMIRYDTTKS